jgi:hypothetical protein
MIDPEELRQLRTQVAGCVANDRALLDDLLREIEPLQQKETTHSASQHN